MKWETFESDDALSARAASLLLGAIRENPRVVLGLPTGRTPLGMYDRVVKECGKRYHCFREVTTFNLDEYVGVPRDHPGSYYTYMRHHLYDHIDIDPANAHIPDGTASDPSAECERYEETIRAAGGLQVTFLGVGRNGHIGFNEPGSPFDARTHLVELTESTRKANADCFPTDPVPTHAITMGIATILESRRIILLAAGKGKAAAIERLRSGEIDESFPASALRRHHDVLVLCAAS